MPPLRWVHKVEPVSVAWMCCLNDSTHGSLVGLGPKGSGFGFLGCPSLNPGLIDG